MGTLPVQSLSVWDFRGPINLIYKWRDRFKELTGQAGAAHDELSVSELRAELARVKRERDILKKALSILSRSDP